MNHRRSCGHFPIPRETEGTACPYLGRNIEILPHTWQVYRQLLVLIYLFKVNSFPLFFVCSRDAPFKCDQVMTKKKEQNIENILFGSKGRLMSTMVVPCPFPFWRTRGVTRCTSGIQPPEGLTKGKTTRGGGDVLTGLECSQKQDGDGHQRGTMSTYSERMCSVGVLGHHRMMLVSSVPPRGIQYVSQYNICPAGSTFDPAPRGSSMTADPPPCFLYKYYKLSLKPSQWKTFIPKVNLSFFFHQYALVVV